MALAMPYPYAMPDDPGYAAPAYGGTLGRVIQVSKKIIKSGGVTI